MNNKPKRCGYCYNWMKKSDCPREAKGLKPTCDDSARTCTKFEWVKWALEEETR